MNSPSRRGLLKNAAKVAAAATAGVALVPAAQAQDSGKPEKKAYPTPAHADPNAAPPLFSSVVSYGNLVFASGIGNREKTTIEEATTHVLNDLEKNLIAAGSSMEKVLKVNVYLSDIADWAKMNTSYAGRWGKTPPARTTVAPAGIPGNAMVEIDCIAYI